MRRFAILFLVMFGLSAVFVLLIMTARAMGSAQPPPEAIQALHLTDCQLPCWLGITPGKTTFDEVVQRVNASHPVTTNIRPSENTLDGWYQVGSASVPAIITWDMSGIVVQITLITSDVQNFVAGDVVGYLGTPTCINSRAASAVYASATALAVFGYSINHQRWRTPLNDIEIRSSEGVTNPCSSR